MKGSSGLLVVIHITHTPTYHPFSALLVSCMFREERRAASVFRNLVSKSQRRMIPETSLYLHPARAGPATVKAQSAE